MGDANLVPVDRENLGRFLFRHTISLHA